MENKIVVSVVIVNWNAKRYLEECLSSLTQEVCAFPMEIIVVDNASTDGSPGMIVEKFPHVKLINNKENLGFARANNIGIKQASGNYLALVNSDVHVLKDCITKLVEFCEKNTEVGMVGPRIIGGDEKQQISCRREPSIWNTLCRAIALDAVFPRSRLFNGNYSGRSDQDSTHSVDILSGCFWLINRRALEVVGGLDESFFIYGEDMDWCKRFRDANWDVVFVPHAQAIHYGGASSANSPIRFFVEKQKADIQYWRKHHSRIAVFIYFAITFLHHGLRIIGYSLRVCVTLGRDQAASYKIRRSITCIHWLYTGGDMPFESMGRNA
ncbi:MAG: glycosyltransferase [Methylococcaceae bacterium]|nr:glycosyltransferase [Methylococcaceae bacterium]